jgi:hypothetical protein
VRQRGGKGWRDEDPRIAPALALPHAHSLFLQLLASIYFSAGIYNQLLVGTKSWVVMEEKGQTLGAISGPRATPQPTWTLSPQTRKKSGAEEIK